MSRVSQGKHGWFLPAVRKRAGTFVAGIGFAVVCFLGINAAIGPTSKSQYCGGKCHEMKEAYRSWELSPHGSNAYGFRVECVDCHLPPKERFFSHVVAKVYSGGKDIYMHHFGGQYNRQKSSESVLAGMPNKRCMHCHDSLLVKAGSDAARQAHSEVVNSPGASEYRCVECHENVGHERKSKLFSP